jgi:ABC-type transport system involved in Fe-S cluster assembly fused permease/ATPase subunit
MAFVHLHKQSGAILERRQRLDATLKKIIKRQLPFLIGGTITGVIMTYYYGFLFSIIVNSAIWMLISFIVNKYYYKSTGFKDEKYLLQYALTKINSRRK